jgi:hypothetical protein
MPLLGVDSRRCDNLLHMASGMMTEVTYGPVCFNPK